MVNRWTQQVFQPSPEVVRVNGRYSTLVMHPELFPTVKLISIANIDGRITGEFREMDRIIPGMRHVPELRQYSNRALDQTGDIWLIDVDDQRVAWEQGRRTVKLVSLFNRFISGQYNIEMVGWWGWLESYKEFQRLTTVQIDAGTTPTTITIDDIEDATTGDILEEGDTIAVEIVPDTVKSVPKRAELAVVQTIAGTGPYVLTVDAIHPFPKDVVVGTKVYCFGRVPSSVADVVSYLAVRLVGVLASDITGDPSIGAVMAGLLKSEKTDNYSYTLGLPGDIGGGGKSGLGHLTGSPRMDALLREFRKPDIAVRYL